ncbi:hypothetical protein K504DRAFT_447397 [Pleomassaria siparia CBS 279.74]|uniref:Uncharacterized protein n=1 Tax=Pleomassaria siparia CBS 279.74 TaxID=1314801 RepID=A0A6G1K4M8_9PLEO|nr:hypothetical protein K504DRAFT_447397 [Pleomassaria siparia CBS 279.74]
MPLSLSLSLSFCLFLSLSVLAEIGSYLGSTQKLVARGMDDDWAGMIRLAQSHPHPILSPLNPATMLNRTHVPVPVPVHRAPGSEKHRPRRGISIPLPFIH